MHAQHTFPLGAPTSYYGLPGNLQYLTTRDTTYSTEGDLEFWSRPCGEPLPPPVLEEMRMFRPLSKALTTTSRSLHRSRQLFDDTGGWYGQPLRATTILSVRKHDKVVSEKLPLPRAHAPNDRRDPRAVHHRRWPVSASHCEAQCQEPAAHEGVVAGFAGATADPMALWAA